ncbi:MAG: CerR family C-terminal domain-containing protein [Pirellulaceae bacterium]|nr:CerR family C-terminal domain-containing protein [Pirellulaceae bacterium]
MPDGPDDTRERLLHAAGEVFAEKGFTSATVREICHEAQANVAAVNYHFGDKESLYIAAVQHAHCAQGESVQPDWPPNMPAELKLVEFIRQMMTDMIDRDRPTWQAALIMREMAQPTRACEELVKSFIGPKFAILSDILSELLPAGATERQKHLTAFSIVGQCLLYRFHRPVGRLLLGESEFNALFDLDLLTTHIARFCLTALGRELPALPAAPLAVEAAP